MKLWIYVVSKRAHRETCVVVTTGWEQLDNAARSLPYNIHAECVGEVLRGGGTTWSPGSIVATTHPAFGYELSNAIRREAGAEAGANSSG